MIDFWSTNRGVRFIEGTVPALVKQVERLAVAAEQISRTNEAYVVHELATASALALLKEAFAQDASGYGRAIANAIEILERK
jgi:hypothetical protein